VDANPVRLQASVEERLWPLVETFVGTHEVAGLAVAVVREGEVALREFGVRDVGTGARVTAETMFHLASVSKPVVATAIVSLATVRGTGEPMLDLDAPIVAWVPEFTLADGRAGEVTARGLLSHSSGLPDVADYGWHDPQLGDEALSEFARSLSGWRLQAEPGSAFAYSNAGFELLGLLLARVTGMTFENAIKQQILTPSGCATARSCAARCPEPRCLTARGNAVVGARGRLSLHQAPCSQFDPALQPRRDESAGWCALHAGRGERWGLRRAVGTAGRWATRLDVAAGGAGGSPPWEEAAALGWAVGTYRGHRTLSHSGADPGFGSKLVLVPERRTGVVVLANSNTVPTSAIAAAALDIALADPALSVSSGVTPEQFGEGVAALRALLPSVVGPVAQTLNTSGPDAAMATFHRLAAAEPAEYDIDDEGFLDAVWGAIELHRTSLVWPLLRAWAALRPDSSAAWTMTGWAHQVDGNVDLARNHLRRALDLDPENQEATLIMSHLPPA
jgi:CubicO group peptidase (beta-lactamase class C family)